MLSTLLSKLFINDLPDFTNKESKNEENQLHIPKLESVTIVNVLFADDLTILSWSKYDL